jgi:pSer/pThr/pTyr-binding forkhead associated (FHA) protein
MAVLAAVALVALLAVRQGYLPAPGSAKRAAKALAGPPGSRQRIALRVSIVAADGTTRSAAFREAPVTIGRDPSSDLVLDDPAVSRQHASIVAEGGHLFVIDAGSARGTWVDGQGVQRARVHTASTIRLGSTEIQVL